MTANTAFFDQIFAQIEAGHADEAIGRLAGMLDHACRRDGAVFGVRGALVAHPLFDLLRHEAATGHAQVAGADRIDRVIGAIFAGEAEQPEDRSARMLSDAMGGNALYRAIRARVRHAGALLTRTWRDGRSIAIVGETVRCELDCLGARDLGNVTIAERDTTRAAAIRAALDPSATVRAETLDAFIARARHAGDRFDLLYLPRLADAMATADVLAVLAHAAPLMSATGSIVFPAFMADRIGRGWQRACLDWHPCEHAEAALAAASRRSGLSMKIFGDAAGCFLWCVLAHASEQGAEQGVQR